MARKNNEEVSFSCPVGSFFSDMEKTFGKKSKFFEHLGRSQAEFFKAVRSLIDERIEGLEKKGTAEAGKKSTKIKVE